MPAIQNIVVPVDFSPTSIRAFEYAFDLGKKLQATLHVVHVYPLPTYLFPDGAVMAGPEFTEQVSSAAQRELDAMLKPYLDQGVVIEYRITQGVPHESIHQYADEVKADMIVMGTHGRTGITHLLMGSIAERVVRTSTIPVLTVPQKQSD